MYVYVCICVCVCVCVFASAPYLCDSVGMKHPESCFVSPSLHLFTEVSFSRLQEQQEEAERRQEDELFILFYGRAEDEACFGSAHTGPPASCPPARHAEL